jgi:5-methylcytosine-specific restriction endonuclease McrA
MIKIENITPLGSDKAIPITSIEAQYLERVKKDTNPLSKLIDCIANNNYTVAGGTYALNPNEEEFILNLLADNGFNSLIIAKPSELQLIKNNTDLTIYREPNPNKVGKTRLNNFGKYLFSTFGYEDHFRSMAKKGLWLANQLNIKTCPYCNAQYTLTISTKSKSTKALFQFDHFFSKKMYPHLSLSLYNLIPSCAVCNQVKGEKDSNLIDHYHPYHFDLSSITEFQLVQKEKYTSPSDIREEKLGIKFTKAIDGYDKFIADHEERFDIDAIYDRHRDVVKDLMVQSVIHNSAFKADLQKIKGLFNGDDRLYRRYILGNYGYEDEILNRPLVKMTRDIAKSLKLIKE